MFSRTIVTMIAIAWFLAWGPVTDAAAADPGPARASYEKSETSALMWSLLGTVVPVAMTLPTLFQEADGPGDGQAEGLILFSGVIFGPSLGHFYAGRPGRAFGGIGLRVLAFTAFLGGVAASWDSESSAGNGLAFGGLAATVGLMIWDIASAPGSARSYNEKHQQRRISVGFTPPTRTEGPGLLAVVSF